MISIPAYAKINLALELLGPRADGSTEIRTIFQTIDLADTLEIEAAAPGTVEVLCDDPSLPAGEDNLAGRAARGFLEAFPGGEGARIHLTKRIPSGAGLGGGSSDAAATLIGLCRLREMRPLAGRLQEIARGLGADVPFFLLGGTALGLGRGDEVWPLEDIQPLDVVLAVPPYAIATGEVYARARPRLTPRDRTHTIWRFAWRLSGAGDGEPDFSWVVNELQPASRETIPDARGRASHDGLLEGLRASGALAAALTGSGSAVFGLFPGGTAEAARGRLEADFPEVRTIAARTMDGARYRRALGIRRADTECWGVDKR